MVDTIDKASFENFVSYTKNEMPKRISTGDDQVSMEAKQGFIPVATGVGFETQFKDPSEVVTSGIENHVVDPDAHPVIQDKVEDLEEQYETLLQIQEDFNNHRLLIDYRKTTYDVEGGDVWIHSEPFMGFESFSIGFEDEAIQCAIDNQANTLFAVVPNTFSTFQPVNYVCTTDDLEVYFYIDSYSSGTKEIYSKHVIEYIYLKKLTRTYFEETSSYVYTYTPENSNIINVSLNLGFIEGPADYIDDDGVGGTGYFSLGGYDLESNSFNSVTINTNLQQETGIIRLEYDVSEDLSFISSDYLVPNLLKSVGKLDFKGWINHSKVTLVYRSSNDSSFYAIKEYDLWVTNSPLPIVHIAYDTVQEGIVWNDIPKRNTWLNVDPLGRVDSDGKVYTFKGKKQFKAIMKILREPEKDSNGDYIDTGVEYYGDIGMRVRGSSSQNYPKRQYNVYLKGDTVWEPKLDDNGDEIALLGEYVPSSTISRQFAEESTDTITDLKTASTSDIEDRNKIRKVDMFGMGISDRWVLHGLWFDATLVKNKISYDLFQACGMCSPNTPDAYTWDKLSDVSDYGISKYSSIEVSEQTFGDTFFGSNYRAPRNVFVEFYNNGDYWGVHNFGEKVDHKRLLVQRDGYEYNNTPEYATPFYLSQPSQWHNFLPDNEDWSVYDSEQNSDFYDLDAVSVKVNDITKTKVRVQAYLVPYNELDYFYEVDSAQRTISDRDIVETLHTVGGGYTTAVTLILDDDHEYELYKILGEVFSLIPVEQYTVDFVENQIVFESILIGSVDYLLVEKAHAISRWEVFDTDDNNEDHTDLAYMTVEYPLRSNLGYYYSKYGNEKVKYTVNLKHADTLGRKFLFTRIRHEETYDDDKSFNINIKGINYSSIPLLSEVGIAATSEVMFINQPRESFDFSYLEDSNFATVVFPVSDDYTITLSGVNKEFPVAMFIYDYDKLEAFNALGVNVEKPWIPFTYDSVDYDLLLEGVYEYQYKDRVTDEWVTYDPLVAQEIVKHANNIRIKFDNASKYSKGLIHMYSTKYEELDVVTQSTINLYDYDNDCNLRIEGPIVRKHEVTCDVYGDGDSLFFDKFFKGETSYSSRVNIVADQLFAGMNWYKHLEFGDYDRRVWCGPSLTKIRSYDTTGITTLGDFVALFPTIKDMSIFDTVEVPLLVGGAYADGVTASDLFSADYGSTTLLSLDETDFIDITSVLNFINVGLDIEEKELIDEAFAYFEVDNFYVSDKGNQYTYRVKCKDLSKKADFSVEVLMFDDDWEPISPKMYSVNTAWYPKNTDQTWAVENFDYSRINDKLQSTLNIKAVATGINEDYNYITDTAGSENVLSDNGIPYNKDNYYTAVFDDNVDDYEVVNGEYYVQVNEMYVFVTPYTSGKVVIRFKNRQNSSGDFYAKLDVGNFPNSIKSEEGDVGFMIRDESDASVFMSSLGVVSVDEPLGSLVCDIKDSKGSNTEVFNVSIYNKYTEEEIVLDSENYELHTLDDVLTDEIINWSNSVDIEAGTTVEPPVANGYVYVVTTAGNTGVIEPTWLTTTNAEIVVGDLIMKCAGKKDIYLNPLVDDWKDEEDYAIGDLVVGNVAEVPCVFKSDSIAVSGLTEPTWIEGDVVDGTITWSYLHTLAEHTSVRDTTGYYVNARFCSDIYGLANWGKVVVVLNSQGLEIFNAYNTYYDLTDTADLLVIGNRHFSASLNDDVSFNEKHNGKDYLDNCVFDKNEARELSNDHFLFTIDRWDDNEAVIGPWFDPLNPQYGTKKSIFLNSWIFEWNDDIPKDAGYIFREDVETEEVWGIIQHGVWDEQDKKWAIKRNRPVSNNEFLDGEDGRDSEWIYDTGFNQTSDDEPDDDWEKRSEAVDKFNQYTSWVWLNEDDNEIVRDDQGRKLYIQPNGETWYEPPIFDETKDYLRYDRILLDGVYCYFNSDYTPGDSMNNKTFSINVSAAYTNVVSIDSVTEDIIETVVREDDDYDDYTGVFYKNEPVYRKGFDLFHLDSVVIYSIISQLSKNADSYDLSGKIYKRRGDKLLRLSLWDWDRTYGYINEYNPATILSNGWYTVGKTFKETWGKYWCRHPKFIKRWKEIWDKLTDTDPKGPLCYTYSAEYGTTVPAEFLARIEYLYDMLEETLVREGTTWDRSLVTEEIKDGGYGYGWNFDPDELPIEVSINKEHYNPEPLSKDLTVNKDNLNSWLIKRVAWIEANKDGIDVLYSDNYQEFGKGGMQYIPTEVVYIEV